MVNIAFIVHTASGGGAERVASVLASEFASRREHSASLIAFYPVDGEYSVSEEVFRAYLFESAEAYHAAGKLERLRRIRECVTGLGAAYAIPFLWYVCIYTQTALAGTGVRVVATVRNNPAVIPSSAVKRMMRDASIAFAWKGFVQTEEQREYFRPFVRRKLHVIPNPVSPAFIGLDADPSQTTRVVMIGRLEPQKGHKTMIEACKLLIERGFKPRVSIYGEGKSRASIQEAIDESGLSESCSLEGRTSDVLSVLANTGVYVLASTYEGMPNSLMEAMAAGVPCISTDCPTGPAELIDDGRNGYLVEVGDSLALATRIEELLTNPSLRKSMGSAAKVSITQRFSPFRIANAIESDLLDLSPSDTSTAIEMI